MRLFLKTLAMCMRTFLMFSSSVSESTCICVPVVRFSFETVPFRSAVTPSTIIHVIVVVALCPFERILYTTLVDYFKEKNNHAKQTRTQYAVEITGSAGRNDQEHARTGVLGPNLQSWNRDAGLERFTILAQSRFRYSHETCAFLASPIDCNTSHANLLDRFDRVIAGAKYLHVLQVHAIALRPVGQLQ